MKLYLSALALLMLASTAGIVAFINVTSQWNLLLRNLRYGDPAGLISPGAFFLSSIVGASLTWVLAVKRHWSWLKSLTILCSVLLLLGVIFLPSSFIAGLI